MGGSSSKNDLTEKPKKPSVMKFVTGGLPNAGKSSLIFRLGSGEIPQHYLVTIGIDFKILYFEGIKLQAWDFTGRGRLRYITSSFLRGSSGLIFMVDSSDESLFEESFDHLNKILKDELVCDIPIMVVANKQDLDGAVGPEVIEEKIKEKCTIGQGVSLFVMPMSVTSEDDHSMQLAYRLFVKTMLRMKQGKVQTGLIPHAWETAEKEALTSEIDGDDDVVDEKDEKDNVIIKAKEKDGDLLPGVDNNKKKTIFENAVHLLKLLR